MAISKVGTAFTIAVNLPANSSWDLWRIGSAGSTANFLITTDEIDYSFPSFGMPKDNFNRFFIGYNF